MRRTQGATLIELIIVMVVLGIVAALSSGYVATAINAYNQAAERNKLILRGRAAIERMQRQLRIALPNSVRVSASGQCIEFMQTVAGANYEGVLPDSANMAPAVSQIPTAPFTPGLGSSQYAVVGAMASTDIYTTAAVSARAAIAGPLIAPVTQIPLTTAHRFMRNSISSRVYVTDSPERFCVSGADLLHYSGYGLVTGVLTDSDPGGSSELLAQDLVTNGPVFQLSPAIDARNVLVLMRFGISRQAETVRFNQQLLVRNVP